MRPGKNRAPMYLQEHNFISSGHTTLIGGSEGVVALNKSADQTQTGL
jgi:hypothetical protein